MSSSLDAYRKTLHRRAEQQRREETRRRCRARQAAHRVARLLRKSYGASRILLFGSIARDGALGPRSDIDLAVWGLNGTSYYEAVANAQDEAAPFEVDLIRMERCSASLREAVQREGCEL